MPQKGPHISISPDFVVNRILRINIDDFQNWPESVREFAISIAEELFLAAYFLFEDKHAFLGETLAGTGLAGALSIIKGQQTGKADEERDTGKHGYVGSVLGFGDLEG